MDYPRARRRKKFAVEANGSLPQRKVRSRTRRQRAGAKSWLPKAPATCRFKKLAAFSRHLPVARAGNWPSAPARNLFKKLVALRLRQVAGRLGNVSLQKVGCFSVWQVAGSESWIAFAGGKLPRASASCRSRKLAPFGSGSLSGQGAGYRAGWELSVVSSKMIATGGRGPTRQLSGEGKQRIVGDFMAETVFVLGPGASKLGGAPLMADFLDTAELLLHRGEVWRAQKEHFDRVFMALAKLYPVHSKAELDLTNIESAFAMLEMARTLSRLPGTQPEEIEVVIDSLKQVIAITLELSLRLDQPANSYVLPPKPYSQFAHLISHLLNKAHPKQTVAVLTFKYDMPVDYALYIERIAVDYGLEDSTRGLPLLKLHGSLSWGLCLTCKKVLAWPFPEGFSDVGWLDFLSSQVPRTVQLKVASRLGELTCCNSPIAPVPVLVLPTWSKGEYHWSVSRVWTRAAQELSEAENIFVCGYSLPATDAFFNYLYALGTEGERPLKRFWVCDPDESGLVEGRFRALLGPGAKRRFQYKALPFHQAIGIIEAEFPGQQ